MWEELYPHSSKDWNFPSPPRCGPLWVRAQKRLPQESLLPALRPHGSLVLGVSYENHSCNVEKSFHGEIWKKMGKKRERESSFGAPPRSFLVLLYETKMAPLCHKLQRWATKNSRKMLPAPWMGAWGKGSSQEQLLKRKEFLFTFPTNWNAFNSGWESWKPLPNWL